jgi:hypothetical protein
MYNILTMHAMHTKASAVVILMIPISPITSWVNHLHLYSAAIYRHFPLRI